MFAGSFPNEILVYQEISDNSAFIIPKKYYQYIIAYFVLLYIGVWY